MFGRLAFAEADLTPWNSFPIAVVTVSKQRRHSFSPSTIVYAALSRLLIMRYIDNDSDTVAWVTGTASGL